MHRLTHLLAWTALATTTGAAAAGTPGNAVAGKSAFRACVNCHLVGPGARGGFGPQLNGLIGRTAGSTPDYNYSAAMRSSKIVWTEASLAAFIRDPDRSVPGTKMRFSGAGYDDRKIDDLLAYLRAFQFD